MLPASVSTASVTFGKALGAAGSEGTLDAVLTMDRTVIHAATGWSINPANERLAATAGGDIAFRVAHVDQDGFLDASGETIKNWYYILTVTKTFPSGTSLKVTKRFQPLVGQTTIDLDLVPDGDPLPEMVAPQASVLSVNGDTGNVTVAGADKSSIDVYNAELIDEEDSETRARLNAAIATSVGPLVADAIADDETLALAAIDALNDAIAAGGSTSPSVVTRTNLAADPTGAGTGGWSTSGSLYTGTRALPDATVTRRVGASSMKTVRTATSPSNYISQPAYLGQTVASVAAGLPVEAGKTYTWSVYGRIAVAGRARITIVFYDAANAVISTHPESLVDVTVGEFARYSATLTAPAGAVRATCAAHAALPTGGVTVGGEEAWWQDFQLEESEAPTPYFDGSLADTADTDYEWTGTPHASTSTAATTIPGTVGLDVEAPQAGANVSSRVLREWAQAEAWEPITLTRDGAGAVSAASILWPDGSTGELSLTRVAGDVSTYSVTHVLSGKKVTQPAITRDPTGAVITKPALTVGAI